MQVAVNKEVTTKSQWVSVTLKTLLMVIFHVELIHSNEKKMKNNDQNNRMLFLAYYEKERFCIKPLFFMNKAEKENQSKGLFNQT